MGRKKGFWIKTDGTIAVDLTPTPIQAATFRKYKQRQSYITANGKSSKEVRTKVIPDLRKRIAHEIRYRKYYKYFLTQVETKANAKIKESQIAFKKKIRSENTKWKAAQKKTINREASKIARTLFKNRVANLSAHSGHILHATIGYSILNTYLRDSELTPKEHNTMVAMTYYTSFFLEDAVDWGTAVSNADFFVTMKKLLGKGYVISFRSKRVSYVLSVAGKEYLKKYDEFYHKMMRKLIKNRK